MAGHSKWSTIKRKKGALDAQRGKIFTKINREITVAAKIGGGDPEANAALRTAIIKARAANMPKDNIDRAIKKGTGEQGGADYMELLYEAYGPGGVAIMIMTLTDNRNRTASEVKSTLTKNGGSLGSTGSVSYLFNRKGVILIEGEDIDEEDLMMHAIEAGAEDFDASADDVFEITTEPNDFEAVLTAIQEAGYKETSAEITLVPETTVELDHEGIEKTLSLIEKLEDLDDVQSISSNIEIPDDFDME